MYDITGVTYKATYTVHWCEAIMSDDIAAWYEATVWWYINVLLACTFNRFSYLPLTLQCVIEILSMFCKDLNENINIACYDEEQIVNS